MNTKSLFLLLLLFIAMGRAEGQICYSEYLSQTAIQMLIVIPALEKRIHSLSAIINIDLQPYFVATSLSILISEFEILPYYPIEQTKQILQRFEAIWQEQLLIYPAGEEF